MNVKRFTARTSRDALGLVKHALGSDAVILSTRPCPEGVEVLAMPPDAVPGPQAGAGKPAARAARPALPAPKDLAESTPAKDAERLSMSTLSFQDYVRERMLRRRRAEMQAQAEASAATSRSERSSVQASPAAADVGSGASSGMLAAAAASARLSQAVHSLSALETSAVPAAAAPRDPLAVRSMAQTRRYVSAGAPAPEPAFGDFADDSGVQVFGSSEPPVLNSSLTPLPEASQAHRDTAAHEQLVQELHDVKQLIDQRFGALVYIEKLQRDPRKADVLLRLLQAGLSPAMTRRLTDHLPAEGDAWEWAAGVLERNLQTSEKDASLEDTGGVFALVGPTGSGKTLCTAKLAAAFAARHGASQLGLITLDAMRVGSQEQLRSYGKFLGVSVHTAHDRASLDDLLDLLSAKKMVLIDTAGTAPHDERTPELLEMLGHRSMQRLLVLNATAQGEWLDDVVGAYKGGSCRGVLLSKLDESVKLGPVLDVAIRHRLKVLGVANGQRVPEDWHRLPAHALVQRALRVPESASWKMNADDVNLILVQTQNGARGRE